MNWTPRQRRYIAILKRRRMNQSRPVKFPPGTLVKFIDGHGMIFEVDHNSGPDSCWIKTRLLDPTPVSEDDLRTLYWYEFAFHRSPMKGHWMIGKNRALPLLLAFGILLVSTIASFVGVEDGWKWAAPGILALMVTFTAIGTARNFHGKRM
jgi:hypothetical protein